ncbi:MAG: kelch repeat-containing protein [Flavobacteriales bacterium]
MRKLNYLWLICLSPILALTQYNTWTKKADFIAGKRERAVAFSIGDFGYVSTGIDTAETLLKDLWQYNPATDTWQQKADLPGAARRDAVAFSVNGKGYVGTGIDNTNALLGTKLKDLWEYNPLTNTWIQKADFPGSGGNGIYFATAFSVENKGYICGGKWGPSLYSSQLWEYKPSSDQWIQRANFPAGVRYQLSSFTIGNQAYVGLGANQDTYKKDFYRYNPGTNQWTQIADFIGSERGSACSFTIQNRGFICLGTNGGLLGDLLEYNPVQNEWEVRCAYGGSERKNAICFVVNDRAYVGLGKGYSGKKASLQEYAAPNYAALNELALNTQIFPNPSNGNVWIKMTVPMEQVIIYDAYGKQCFELKQHHSKEFMLSLNEFPTGIYYARIQSAEGQWIQKQLIIE